MCAVNVLLLQVLHFHVLHVHFLQFHVLHICFMSCNFMPRDFKRPFVSRPAFSVNPYNNITAGTSYRRLLEGTPAHDALHASAELLPGTALDPGWSRKPGRPRSSWLCDVLKVTHLTAQEARDSGWWSWRVESATVHRRLRVLMMMMMMMGEMSYLTEKSGVCRSP